MKKYLPENMGYNLPAGRQFSLVSSTILLQLIVFLLPTQLGLHFWPDFARAAGLKVDYLSPTLYLIDIFLLLSLVYHFSSLLAWIKSKFPVIIVFLIFIFLNTTYSLSVYNTLFWWLHWLLYSSFFLVLRLKKVTWLQIKTPLILATCLIVGLEVFQLYYQSSIGGLFYWLGERHFTNTTSALGRLNLAGLDFVRPPSTFSHANSLAGFLLIIYYLLHYNKSPLWIRLITFLGLVLTFSKAALLAFLLVLTFQINSIFLIWFFLTLSIVQLFIPTTIGIFQFVSDRLFLLQPTKKIIFSSPLLGVGLGNFIPSLTGHLSGSFLIPSKIQPVHNLPLLFIAETGLLGVSLLFGLIKANLKTLLKPQILALLALTLITGAFDHYWWTLPQNKLLLLFALALML